MHWSLALYWGAAYLWWFWTMNHWPWSDGEGRASRNVKMQLPNDWTTATTNSTLQNIMAKYGHNLFDLETRTIWPKYCKSWVLMSVTICTTCQFLGHLLFFWQGRLRPATIHGNMLCTPPISQKSKYILVYAFPGARVMDISNLRSWSFLYPEWRTTSTKAGELATWTSLDFDGSFALTSTVW